MASEAEASCESDPNFAIICAFMEKFGELCGIESIDFVELQKMLENNQEVSQELVNLHVMLLKKSKKKNVTVERWERALINMCHTFSSKDAWEIERFGYKNTRLQIKLRALKELLEMQFDYNVKFKNAINKMTSDTLRSEPLGRDKMGRAYWFQTDNNYQIRIYKEDADEETWHLIAKDRAGLVALISELSDGDSKFSSDSAFNEDSNSLLEKPFIDTGQTDNSNEAKPKEQEKKVEMKISEIKLSEVTMEDSEKSKTKELTTANSTIDDAKSSSDKSTVIEKEPVVPPMPAEKPAEQKIEASEVKRPMLRIKSLSELMEKPKEPTREAPSHSFLPNLPGITIIKKPKLDLPEITIVKRPRNEIPGQRNVQVTSAIQSPLMIIRGNGSGRDNKCGNPAASEGDQKSPRDVNGQGSAVDTQHENSKEYKKLDVEMECPIVGEEIEEPVIYFLGMGSGKECETGNEKEVTKDEETLSNNCSVPPRQLDDKQVTNQVPTSPLTSFKLGTVIDTKTENKTFLPRDPNKRSRWDQKDSRMSENQPEEKDENSLSPKKMTFFFGPGSLNVKMSPASHSNVSDSEQELSESGKAISREINFTGTNNMQFTGTNESATTSVNIEDVNEEDSKNSICESKEEKDTNHDDTEKNDISEIEDAGSGDKSVLEKSCEKIEIVPSSNSSQKETATQSLSSEINSPKSNDEENERRESLNDEIIKHGKSQEQKKTEPVTEPCNDGDINDIHHSSKNDMANNSKEGEAIVPDHPHTKPEAVQIVETEEQTDIQRKEEKRVDPNFETENLQKQDSKSTFEKCEPKEQESESGLISEKQNDSNAHLTLDKTKTDVCSEEVDVKQHKENATNNDENVMKELKVSESDNKMHKEEKMVEHDTEELKLKHETNNKSVKECGKTASNISAKSAENEITVNDDVDDENVDKNVDPPVESDSENGHDDESAEKVENFLTAKIVEESITDTDHTESEKNQENNGVDAIGSEPINVSHKNAKIETDNISELERDNKTKDENKEVDSDQDGKTVDSEKSEKGRNGETSEDIKEAHEITDSKASDDVTNIKEPSAECSEYIKDIYDGKESVTDGTYKMGGVSNLKGKEKLTVEENLIKLEKTKIIQETTTKSESGYTHSKEVIKDVTDVKKIETAVSREIDDLTKVEEASDEKSKNADDIVETIEGVDADLTEGADSTKNEKVGDTKNEEADETKNEEAVDTKNEETDDTKQEEAHTLDTLPTRRKRTARSAQVVKSISKVDIEEVSKKKAPIERKTRGNQRGSKQNEVDKILPVVPGDSDKVTEIDNEAVTKPDIVVVAARPTRQTRQTRAGRYEVPIQVQTVKAASTKAASTKAKVATAKASTAAVKAVPVPTRAKTRSKRTAEQAAKAGDRTTDSPVPLESVTVVDSDSNCPPDDTVETDPLAVSDEELTPKDPIKTVSSVTSFSFDYNPDSPVAVVKPPSARSLRKRGRECIETKPEVGETGGKKAKIKGKRTVDLELRKSVEEKRQAAGLSSDDNDSVQEPKTKGSKKSTAKKQEKTVQESDSENAAAKPEKSRKKRKTGTNRVLQNLGIKEEDISMIADSSVPMRQSRRLAQLKIKEDATRRKIDDEESSIKKKKKKVEDKDFKAGKRKRIEEEVKPAPTPPMVEKKKQRKKTKHKDKFIGWKSSSEDSDASCQEEEEVSEYEEPHEEEPLQFKSDHEFSPESDLENEEPSPLKRARTARKEEQDEEEIEEEFHCQKCSKSDHPEWILLCDKCDNGWHCSCLRPALFVIPEGDWYCPTCQHEMLVEKLHTKLVEYDKSLLRKEMEDRRKERLAYVGISLNNVLPAKEKKEKVDEQSSDSGSAASSDSSDSDEPIYQLRQRRQAHSYKFQDYDDLINSALQEEPQVQSVRTHATGRGKDIATIVNAAKEEEERNAERNGFDGLPPVVPRDPEEMKRKAISYRKKPKRLNNLEVNSDDEGDDSDEDFKGSSSEESEEDDVDEDSDDSFVGKRRSKGVRRSTRARTTRFDADFINDDDSDYDDSPRKKKKKQRAFLDDSESELSDDWRGQRKKSHKNFSRKKSKKKKSLDDSDLETYRKKKPKIKYGMDSEDEAKGRRTRGKRTSYLDTLGSDSEEENLKRKNRERSDDEYVAEDEEKESEEDEYADVEKGSEEEEQENSNRKQSNSEDDEGPLVVKKLRIKNRRTIVDSEEEEEVAEDKQAEKESEPDDASKEDKIEEAESDEKLESDSKNENESSSSEKSQELRDLEKQALEKPPSVLLPVLNMERLKACGITLTKVINETPEIEEKESPKLIEIGNKPPLHLLNQRTDQKTGSIDRPNKNLDEFEEKNEEYSTRPLHLAGVRIQHVKHMNQGASLTPIPKELSTRPQLPTMMNRKPGDNTLKKVRTGRFFNMKPPLQEPMLGGAPLMMNDDDNDELSEPPGVTLPLFSEIGPSSMQGPSRLNTVSRFPPHSTPPPPMGSNRASLVPLHGMARPMSSMLGPNRPEIRPSYPIIPNPIPDQKPSIGPEIPAHLIGPGGINVSRVPALGAEGPNMLGMGGPSSLVIKRPGSAHSPNNAGFLGHPQSLPAVPVGSNPSPSTNAHIVGDGSPPMSLSPDGTPKKRRGRGKGKKTLAAEAAAAAAAAGLPIPEPNTAKTGSNKPLVGNIEIASPPQPFSQSQPAPSVITRMLQNSPGKGAFPVGRIRPKQFAMMPAGENESEVTRSLEAHGDSPHKNVPTHTAPTSHPPGPYGGPPPGQFPPSYYNKDGQVSTPPPHGYHPQQRQSAPNLHSYPPNSNQPPVEQSLNQAPLHPPPVKQSHHPPPVNQAPHHPPPVNQPAPVNPPAINQPPMSISETPPPPMGQYTGTPPPPTLNAKPAYDPMTHRQAAYPGQGYNYEYNAPPSQAMNPEDPVAPPYDNPAPYGEQYGSSGSNMDPNMKIVEDESGGEFGGLVSYFSSQHEDDLDT